MLGDVVKQSFKLIRFLGLLAVVAGIFWLCQIGVLPAIEWIRDLGGGVDESKPVKAAWGLWSWVIVVPLYLLVLGLGGMQIYWGIGLLKDPPPPRPLSGDGWSAVDVQRAQIATDPVVNYVRYILVILAFFGLMSLTVKIQMIAAVETLPGSLWFFLKIIIGILVVAPCYVVAVRLVLRGRGYRNVELCYVISKPLVVPLAWAVWSVLRDLVEWRWPEQLETNPAYDEGPLETLLSCGLAFGPIVVAVLFYRFTVRLLGYREMELDLRRLGVRHGDTDSHH